MINSNRKNGYLDLDNYFLERMGRSFKQQELFQYKIIAEELDGGSDKFWILSDKGEKIALFKQQLSYTKESYAELFSEEVCKILDIPTAHYDLATFKGKYGVISYNFIEDYDSYYAGYDIIADFYEEVLLKDEKISNLYKIDSNDDIDSVTDKLNNLEDIWTILEDYYHDNPRKKEIVSNIVNHLIDKLIFDIIMINVDDHCDNWGVLDNKLSPMFDNARVLNMHNISGIYDEKINLEEKKLLFTVDNSEINKPLEVLEHFLKISSSEYKEYLINKINILEANIEVIPLIIEKRTEYPIPNYLKQYFIKTLHQHLDKINMIINNKTR